MRQSGLDPPPPLPPALCSAPCILSMWVSVSTHGRLAVCVSLSTYLPVGIYICTEEKAGEGAASATPKRGPGEGDRGVEMRQPRCHGWGENLVCCCCCCCATPGPCLLSHLRIYLSVPYACTVCTSVAGQGRSEQNRQDRLYLFLNSHRKTDYPGEGLGGEGGWKGRNGGLMSGICMSCISAAL